jgi:mRNA interferase RelE/StbE
VRYYRNEDRRARACGGEDLDAPAQDPRKFVMSGPIRYAMSGEGDGKRLSGRGGFRLRIGRYRVIFDEDAATILAVAIGKRETTTPSRN